MSETPDRYHKVTTGFVTQIFVNGVCRDQTFTAGCSEYEVDGEPIEAPDPDPYEPFYMVTCDSGIPIEECIESGEFDAGEVIDSDSLGDQAARLLDAAYDHEILGDNLWQTDTGEVVSCVLEVKLRRADPGLVRRRIEESLDSIECQLVMYEGDEDVAEVVATLHAEQTRLKAIQVKFEAAQKT
jgi:hypothetical protein